MRRVFRIPFSTNNISREVDDELAFHFDMRIQRLMAAGYSRDAAHAEALRQFGDVAGVRASMMTIDEQRERSNRRSNMMSELQQDLGYALRTLRRNIGFTAIIVIALAVGIGANTAIFTLIDAVLMRQLPVSHPEQLVAIGNPTWVGSLSQGAPRTDLISAPLYRDLRAQNQVFTDVLASGRTRRLDVRIEENATDFEHPRGRFVSSNYFSVLGVKPVLGRALEASMDDVAGSSPVLVISHGYWTRRFHNDPSVLGKTILLNGVKMTIIGIAPERFTGDIVGMAPDVWLPLSMADVLQPHQKLLDHRSSSWLLLLGRLAPGATLAQASKEIPTLIDRSILTHSTADVTRDYRADHHTYHVQSGARGFSRVRSSFEAPLYTLMIGVVLLLCIICANVANLLLARAIARGREMAVRLALGADRRRLVRQLLTESVVLAALSAGAGLLVAWWGSRALLVLASDGPTMPIRLAIDLPVLGFTLGVSVLAVALFGLAPALRASRVDFASTLRANSTAVTGSALGRRGQRAPLGTLLVAGQVAFSVVLLVGAAMLVRSLRNLQTTDVGLDRDHLVIVEVDLTSRGYTLSELHSYVRTAHDRLAALPGVAAVAFSENGIFSGTESGTSVQIPGFVPRAAGDTLIAYDQVSSGYAKAIGARLIAGRDLDRVDEDRLPRTAIVNQSLASFYFPGGNAVGQFMRFDTVAVEIVGVIADTRDHELTGTPDRRAYFPYVHLRDRAGLGTPGSLVFAVRTMGDPATLVQAIRRSVNAIDPQVAITDAAPLAHLMRATIGQQRLVAQLATAFGLLALLLAAVGLYGVMTYAITRRTGEIGLRIALGAQQSTVIAMVLRDAIRLVGVGVVVGLPLALGAAHLLRTQLHDVATIDPFSIVLAVGVLTTSAVVAVTLPAWRASKVSPIVALRAD